MTLLARILTLLDGTWHDVWQVDGVWWIDGVMLA